MTTQFAVSDRASLWSINGKVWGVTNGNERRCWRGLDTMFSPWTSTAKEFDLLPRRPHRPRQPNTKHDRALLRARVRAGLDVLRNHEFTDVLRVAAIGYCFGGTTVLELARSGADIGGVVSFHGGLGTPKPEDARNTKAKVLALHGADDPYVPPKEVAEFEDEMRQGKVDWQLVAYGGAVHSFTDSNAGNDNSKGSAYNERADRRSWEAMKQFFSELFK
jgi:dienelactone hydrolase